MNACSIQPWIMASVALAIVLLMLWVVRVSHREVIGKYAKQWGVDMATAAAVRARREPRFNGILSWLAVSPVFVIAIGVLTFAIGDMVPAFRACIAPSSTWSRLAIELTVLVYCFPFSIAAVALIIFLTPPRLIAYRRALAQLKRQDLPGHPTLADFEAALPPLVPLSARTRLVSLAVCAAGVAVLVWLTINHASDVIFDFIIPHRANPIRAVAIRDGLSHIFLWLQIGLCVVSVSYGLYICWLLLTGEGRVYRKLGVKWSLPPNEIRRLVNARRGTGYRVLRMIWFGTMFLCIVGAVGIMALPPKQTAGIEAVVMLLGSGFVFFTGLLVTCCAQSSAYARALSSALQTQSPTADISAFTVAAGIDRAAIADQAKASHIVGPVIIFLAGVIMFSVVRTLGSIDHLAHILPWR